MLHGTRRGTRCYNCLPAEQRKRLTLERCRNTDFGFAAGADDLNKFLKTHSGNIQAFSPALAILGSIIFGGLYIASSYISGITFAQIELIKALPYVVTIIVLIITSILNSKETQPPASLGLNYFREER